jgi:hypothetical protein
MDWPRFREAAKGTLRGNPMALWLASPQLESFRPGDFKGVFFFDAFRRGASREAAMGFLQAGSSSPQMTEPVDGGASAISIAFFVAASMAKSLPLNFPTRRTWHTRKLS